MKVSPFKYSVVGCRLLIGTSSIQNARYYFKCLANINLFNPYNTLRGGMVTSPVYLRRIQGNETFRNVPKFRHQPVRGRWWSLNMNPDSLL